MTGEYTKCLFVTANVGSIFEDPDRMLKLWLGEFLSFVDDKSPDFLAIHCQEVGGKNYEESMQHVNIFVKSLLASETMQKYDKVRVFLDEDFTAVDKFTALGSLYFIHESIQNIQIWDFEERVFKDVTGQEVLSGNIEQVTIKEKAKFPQEFFPNHKWSRKGFIRTRWNVCSTIFDLINIHLFHDASNLIAMEKSPSEYSVSRRNALMYTIKRFETDEFGLVPYFIFGDFNFRLDLHNIIQSLTERLQEHRKTGKKNELSRITYTDGDPDKVILTIEKKCFDHLKHHDIFFSCSQWLRGFDLEPNHFSDKLLEYTITHPPSYPFSEDIEDGRSYMKTRCPAWCDRVMFSPSAKSLILEDDNSPQYDMLGANTCMGDHKPVYLSVKLRQADPGNRPRRASCPEYVDSGDPSSLLSPARRPLKKVISINGTEVETTALDEINIHDYTTFEHERFITKFINSVRRRPSVQDPKAEATTTGSGAIGHRQSFRDVVRNIMKVEHVIQVWYSHRSDTEDDSDLDLDDRVTDPVADAPIRTSDVDVRPTDGDGDSDATNEPSVRSCKRPAGDDEIRTDPDNPERAEPKAESGAARQQRLCCVLL